MRVITITGSNEFGRSTELRRVVSDFVELHGDLALERLDGEEHEFARIQEALTSLPFLVNKKMVVLQRPSGNGQFVEAAEGLLAGLPDTTELVLVDPKLDKRSSLYKLLKKQTDFRDFTALDEAQLARWLCNEARAAGAELSLADARYLIERVGRNQQLLAGELEKLRLYDPAITRASIELLTDMAPQSTIFALIEAAFAGNRQRALALYDEQRLLKVEPIQIIAMFAWQLHVLALVCAAKGQTAEQIAAAAKLNSYTVSKTMRLNQRISLSQVKQLVDELVSIDQRSKRESLDLDEALRTFIVRLG